MTLAKSRLLSDVHPELVGELVDPSVASMVTYGSNRKLEWRCPKCGNVYETTPKARHRGQGCPYCSGRRVLAGFNDIATVRPDLAAELVDQTLATRITLHSNRLVEWRCPTCGHVWTAPANNRASGEGCPCCSGNAVQAGVNDLATTHPDLASDLVDQTLATQLSAGSERLVEWRCAKGHTWRAAVYNRAHGTGCPYCSGRLAVPGETDLATERPEIAAELVDQTLATRLRPYARLVTQWRCQQGHVWTAGVKERSRGNGCPVCAASAHASTGELALLGAVRTLVGPGVAVVHDDRSVIAPFELDVTVPSRHLAFEFDGTFWHSDAVRPGRTAQYDKMRSCRDKGWQLVQVWEDDWEQRHDVAVMTIAHKLHALGRLPLAIPGIDPAECSTAYARNLAFREVTAREARPFLEAHHLQGFVSATCHFALVDADGRIHALLSARSPEAAARTHRSPGQWELVRFATMGSVPGGASKLLRHATDVLRPRGLTSWVSFSANDVSNGGLYRTLGFVLDRELPPDYRYAGNVTRGVRRPKEAFQKRAFERDPRLAYKPGLTESELAAMNGLHRTWDSGKLRWVLAVSS